MPTRGPKNLLKAEGRWITTEGTHVHLSGSGKVDAGPAALEGKPIDSLPKREPATKKPVKSGPISDNARPKLTEDEESALEHYTASAWINDELRGLPIRPEATQYFSEARRNQVRRELVSAFKKVKPMPNSTPVYRGAGFDTKEEADQFLGKMRRAAASGKEITTPGYSSTSPNKSAASEYAGEHGVLIKIAAREGLHLNHYSAGDSRGELLLNHNSRFKVDSVSDEDGRTVVTLTQLVGAGGSEKSYDIRRKRPSEPSENRFVDDSWKHWKIG